MRARPTAWAARCALRSSGASGSGVPVHVEVVGAACAPSPSSRTPARACRGPESTTREAVRGVKRDEGRAAEREFEARGGRARLKPTARPGRRGDLRWPDRDMANSAVKGQKPGKAEISEGRAVKGQVRSRRHSHRSLFERRTHQVASRGGVALERTSPAPLPSRRLRLNDARSFPRSAGEGRLARTDTTAKPSAWSRSAARHGGHEPAPDALVAHMWRKSTRREKEKGGLTAMFARCSREAPGGYVKKHDFHLPPPLGPSRPM